MTKALQPIKTQLSKNLKEQRRNVLSLYRQWLRSAQEITDMYNLPVTTADFKNRIKHEFIKNKNVDSSVVDILVFKGTSELHECMNHWKQPCHVMAYFPTDVYSPPNKTFLSKFYANQ